MEELRKLADATDSFLIEDCAHRIDLLDQGPPVGDLCCYSFNAVKECPGGEGGLLWGRDFDLEPRARSLSNLGMSTDPYSRSRLAVHPDYLFSHNIGLKLRLNDLSASLVRASLAELQETREQRREIAQRYHHLLAVTKPEISLLPVSSDSSWLMNVLRVPASARDVVRNRLGAEGIGTSFHYPSLSSHPLFNRVGTCPTAEATAEGLLTLPSFLGLDIMIQRKICSRVLDALA